MQGASPTACAHRQRLPLQHRSTLTLALVLAVSGGCAHTQKPERRVYVISESVVGIGGSGGRNCDAEHIACFDKCWNATPPLAL